MAKVPWGRLGWLLVIALAAFDAWLMLCAWVTLQSS